MTVRLQLFIGIFLLIIMFFVVFFVNQRLWQQVLRNSAYLNHSEAVIRNSNMIHRKVIEMQSSFRGYLLAGQEGFLQPYYAGAEQIPLLINNQRNMLNNNYQKRILDSIALLHNDWVQYSDSLITTKKDTLPEATIKYQRLFNSKFKMEYGEKLSRMIRQKFNLFDNFEYDNRQQRRAALQRSIENTRYISWAFTIGSIMLVLISGFYLIRMIIKRISGMVTLAEKISKGDFISVSETRKDEFNRLVKALNKMSETLEKNFNELRVKNNELDQFAYVVSHDLKAPLRGITNIISWMEEDHASQITPEINSNLQLIKGRTNRLENMINGLLDYARIGKNRKGRINININALVHEIKDMIVPAHVELIIGELPSVYGERIHFEQIFSNLISNAFKHNKVEHPRVTVTGRELGDRYEFSVTDNGQGIEQQYFDKIFIIFQTLQERDAFESTGVGLAIVKKIIDDNKGTIRVESELGKGTTFTFTLPKYNPK